MSRTPVANGDNPFSGLDFSPKTDDEKFVLLKECRAIITSGFPQDGLAKMIIRRAENMRREHRGERQPAGTIPDAKEDAITALAVADVWYRADAPETAIFLRQLAQR